MSSSILNSTKRILNLDFAYTAFDTDIITHINAAFSVLNQLGIGPVDGYMIESDNEEWEDLLLNEESDPEDPLASIPSNQLNLVKTYIYLKTRMVFDPPTTSYLIDAMNKQIAECEWRLSCFREVALEILLNATEEEVA